VLISISKMMLDCVRAEDVVARIGGDEFAILLEMTDLPSAKAIADRLVADMRKAFPELGLSIGVADVACSGTVEDAMRNADQHMYEAKGTGKNRVIVGKACAPGFVENDTPSAHDGVEPGGTTRSS
jgi:diguanylate cyclase (GGDEF)-like protein